MRRGIRNLAAVLMTVAVAGVPAGAADPAKPPAVGEEAKDFELEALGGGKEKLSKLAGPVVLVVLRGHPGDPGFQCQNCADQAADFLGRADGFKAAGATVVFVYPGPAEKLKEHAAEFVKGKDYPAHFKLLLDPDYTFTTAYGLRWDARGETAHPASFVLDGRRTVTFAQVSKTHGDRAKAADVLKALAKK